MHEYRVIDCRVDHDRVLLEGGSGHYHWARVLREPPRVGDVLYGTQPQLGFGVLRCSRSAFTFRVIFEAVDDVDPGINMGSKNESN